MNIEQIVPVPYCVARRGWEAAYDLTGEFLLRMQQHEREAMAWIVAKGPTRITWRECRSALHLHRSIVGVRT